MQVQGVIMGLYSGKMHIDSKGNLALIRKTSPTVYLQLKKNKKILTVSDRQSTCSWLELGPLEEGFPKNIQARIGVGNPFEHTALAGFEPILITIKE